MLVEYHLDFMNSLAIGQSSGHWLSLPTPELTSVDFVTGRRIAGLPVLQDQKIGPSELDSISKRGLEPERQCRQVLDLSLWVISAFSYRHPKRPSAGTGFGSSINDPI